MIKEFYLRKEILQELLRLARGREVQAWFGDVRGMRPEIVNFEGDLRDLINQGMTSFHVSEERWSDPLVLKPGLGKKDLDNFRVGWDAIIDIDSKNLEFSKICAELIIDALKFYDLKSYSVKFSGNHGFHIGIPFEAFPKEVNSINIKDHFPDGVRIISEYLKSIIKEFLSARILSNYTIETAAKSVNKPVEDIKEKICKTCDKIVEDIIELKCNSCGFSSSGSFSQKDFEKCLECSSNKILKNNLFKCKCGIAKEKKNTSGGGFDPFKVVDIDSVLISSRHLFRCVYSVNEKSGLVSIPVNSIKDFNIEDAKIENVKFDKNLRFLDSDNVIPGEARNLLIQAFDPKERKTVVRDDIKKIERTFEIPKVAIKSDYFPPCMLSLMSGVKEDGRKRAVFILANFLQSVGWSMEEVEKFLLEWNKRNKEPLREGYIMSQISWFKRQKKTVLPPNCDNPGYYKTMGVKCEDGICSMCKNPVNYVFRRLKLAKQQKPYK